MNAKYMKYFYAILVATIGNNLLAMNSNSLEARLIKYATDGKSESEKQRLLANFATMGSEIALAQSTVFANLRASIPAPTVILPAVTVAQTAEQRFQVALKALDEFPELLELAAAKHAAILASQKK